MKLQPTLILHTFSEIDKTFGVGFIGRGTILLISERLGHENIETTLETYAHLYPNKHEDVAQKLSNIINS